MAPPAEWLGLRSTRRTQTDRSEGRGWRDCRPCGLIHARLLPRWNVHCRDMVLKTPFARNLLFALLMGACFHAMGAGAQNSKAQKSEPDAASPAGVWRGESICATDAPACHNENVVYYVQAIPGKPDATWIRADKIVEGKAITMGSGPWKYDRTNHTLSMESEQRLWLLHVNGKRIEGTLTVPGNVVFRRMTLTKTTG